MDTKSLLDDFINQADSGDLKTASYPKEWNGLKLRISFGMGAPARVPWIAFIAPEITVSNGYYPVYLYYKDFNTLILSYGISETTEYRESWPIEITSTSETIKGYFGKKVPRYGDSYVFKAYTVQNGDEVLIFNNETNVPVSGEELAIDLEQILSQYIQATSAETYNQSSTVSQGIFYLEKQLEDFIIHNWESTDLGEKYDLIVEEGVLLSQQYRTGIGPIDILVKDKKTGSYVVIELKKNQTSDDTIGQVARYMGWIEEKLGDPNVKGIIIAQGYDSKLEYALKRIADVEIYIYEVDFRLREFKGQH
jgi:RecB family endonuclease NucS